MKLMKRKGWARSREWGKENEQEVENEGLKDVIGAKYLKMVKNVCFSENSIDVVEVPVREHGKAEVIEAKEKEIENLKNMNFLRK